MKRCMTNQIRPIPLRTRSLMINQRSVSISSPSRYSTTCPLIENLIPFVLFSLLQEEDDEAYLKTYGDEDDGEDENDVLIRNLYEETDSPFDDQNFELESEPETPDLHSGNGSLIGDEESEEEHNGYTTDSAYTNQNES